MIKYSVIYADPSWQFKNKNCGGSMKSGASSIYPVMSVDDICRLPVQDIAADDCVLCMWWIGSMPEEALQVVKSWGFKVKTMTGFVWIKQTRKLLPFFGMGFWTRAGSECCLIATRGKPKRVSASVRSVFQCPALEHSRKPSGIRDRIVDLCGDVPRIELFAREKSEFWDSWGNEIEPDIEHDPKKWGQKSLEECVYE